MLVIVLCGVSVMSCVVLSGKVWWGHVRCCGGVLCGEVVSVPVGCV